MKSSALLRSLLASRAGIACHLQGDSNEIAARARRGLDAKFWREADPNGTLPEADRKRRYELLKKDHYRKMRIASLKAKGEGR